MDIKFNKNPFQIFKEYGDILEFLINWSTIGSNNIQRIQYLMFLFNSAFSKVQLCTVYVFNLYTVLIKILMVRIKKITFIVHGKINVSFLFQPRIHTLLFNRYFS